jgi:hypothetical protein
MNMNSNRIVDLLVIAKEIGDTARRENNRHKENAEPFRDFSGDLLDLALDMMGVPPDNTTVDYLLWDEGGICCRDSWTIGFDYLPNSRVALEKFVEDTVNWVKNDKENDNVAS